ncbi:ferredoxin/adrenodoxin reductase [Moesziomyces antarcticus T-34]|uniref:adrenodoxin-NADP(+) reductase n=1 Tax=Pseudozyma antarctica (strain T-34) TaxID=1151754 RepID=M9LMF6_PSEA3|nr:ferredoxin/adrenodoxin reductase [Moesziomyces antarcticus T-34]
MRSSQLVRSAAASTSSASLPPRARVAIIGAGPSGFYAASRLLSRIPYSSAHSAAEQPLAIDIFERLPVPHGLVRYGVAPDHPDVKNVENKFASVAQDPRLRFAGNVNVVHTPPSGSGPGALQYPEAVQLPLDLLSRYYTHILFSYGASAGRRLGIPGSGPGELDGVYTALEFVNWYNGHPASHDATLQAAPLHIDLAGKQHMSVVGAGNVALDVARIVMRSSTPFLEPGTASERVTSNKAPGLAALEATDVPEPVLAELARSKVRHVDIFARRGPAQLAFTNKEVREMLALEGIALRTPQKQLLDEAGAQLEQLAATEGGGERAQEVASEVRVKKRLLSLLAKGSKTKHAEDGVKSWALNFFRSPARILPRQNDAHAVGAVEWNVTALQTAKPTVANLDAADPKKAAYAGEPASTSARATGETVTTPTDLVVASVGYQSLPLDPSPAPAVPAVEDGRLVRLPFDARRHVVPNRAGRIVDPVSGDVVPRAYVSGWLARGPTGIIASTMLDAHAVADSMLSDMHTQPPTHHAESHDDLLQLLQKTQTHRIVGLDDWNRIDAEEQARGQKLGKLREKILTVREMLAILQ